MFNIISFILSFLGTMYANGGIPLKYASDGSVAVVSEPRPTQVFDGKEYVSKLIRFLWAIPVHPENCSTILKIVFDGE
jgi:hypothetical protein